MNLDPSIYFIIVIPDAAPAEATPLQGFAMSFCDSSWAIRAASVLPTNIFDLTEVGRSTLLARRMSGIYPVNWHGQSPRAIRTFPNPPFMPFALIILPDSESPKDYDEWASKSELRPTIVAKSGGDLTFADLTIDGLKAHFLKVCDRIPDSIDSESIEEARAAILEWQPMPPRRLAYQVGGHNSVTPNLIALTIAGFDDLVFGRFKNINSGIKPYVDQIVSTTNSILDERDATGPRELQRIFRRPPALNLFAPAIYPSFFQRTPKAGLNKDEIRQFKTAQQILLRQSGYGYELTTPAQHQALFGTSGEETLGKKRLSPHPLMTLRAKELSLSTELMGALAASEFSAVVRLPNAINRTLGSVRNFSEHYRSQNATTRKRLLAFREVQARIDSAIPQEFIELIRRTQGGIRIVSDAHIEWLNLDGLPLLLRRDCTRIPVTPGNQFADGVGPKPLLRLSPEDFKSILVISALNRDDPIQGIFETAFDTFEPLWRDKLAVRFVEVKNADQLVDAINNFEGPMIIFDGHGGHQKDMPATLRIGEETIDVWSLNDRITNMPPIVILSACDTHAADRNHATTANGFMSLGARTVLSSVFPLEAKAAASFAARLVYRVAAFVPPAISMFGEAITWTE